MNDGEREETVFRCLLYHLHQKILCLITKCSALASGKVFLTKKGTTLCIAFHRQIEGRKTCSSSLQETAFSKYLLCLEKYLRDIQLFRQENHSRRGRLNPQIQLGHLVTGWPWGAYLDLLSLCVDLQTGHGEIWGRQWVMWTAWLLGHTTC